MRKSNMMSPIVLCHHAVISLCVLLLQICQAATLPKPTQHYSVHNCHSQTQKQFKMECDTNQMIRINRVIYGYNKDGTCFYQPGDCVSQEKSYYPCVGRQICEINAPQVSGRVIQKCGKPSNYFQVDYECVPIAITKNICEHGELKELSGFLKSPNYPLQPFADRQCSANINVPRGYEVRLHIIDLDLREQGFDDCYDSLSVRQLSSVTLCGRRQNEDLQLTPLNTMQINFHATSGNGDTTNRKGFWLYYEAYDTRTTTTASPTKVSDNDLAIETDSHQTNNLQNNDVKTTEGNDTHTDEIPVAAIIGGVIGSLLLVLVILVALLLLKWWRETCEFKHRTQKKFREVRNNAFQSSNDLFPPVQMEV